METGTNTLEVISELTEDTPTATQAYVYHDVYTFEMIFFGFGYYDF